LEIYIIQGNRSSIMIDDDLDEDIDESIQHYAHKKRENTNSRGLFFAIIIILIVVIALILIFK
jgi:hypothetical protein